MSACASCSIFPLDALASLGMFGNQILQLQGGRQHVFKKEKKSRCIGLAVSHNGHAHIYECMAAQLAYKDELLVSVCHDHCDKPQILR